MGDFKRLHDEWLTPPDEPDVFDRCLRCDGEIHVGQDVYAVPSGHVHMDCFEQWAKDELDARLIDTWPT